MGASSASSRKLAPILRCTSAIKRFPSVKREPAFCGPENAGLKNAGLGAQRERKRRRRNFLVGVGGDPLTALPEIGRPQGCVHVRSGRKLSACSCRCARKHVLSSGLIFFVFYRDSSPFSRRLLAAVFCVSFSSETNSSRGPWISLEIRHQK